MNIVVSRMLMIRHFLPLFHDRIFQSDAHPKIAPAGDGFAIEGPPVWRIPKE
jgi:hypothetical protein